MKVTIIKASGESWEMENPTLRYLRTHIGKVIATAILVNDKKWMYYSGDNNVRNGGLNQTASRMCDRNLYGNVALVEIEE